MITNKQPKDLIAIFEQVAPVFRVLAHPVRLAISNALLNDKLTVGELAEKLEQPQAAVSQHLAQMRAHGLVEANRDGQRVYYKVIHPAAKSVIRCIRDHCC